MAIVKRNVYIDVDRFEVGDVIAVPIHGEDGRESMAEAIAVKQQEDNMIFCFSNCIGGDQAMNSDPTNSGGYEESDLRQTLRLKILPRISRQFAKGLVPFANGDLLRIPTEREIFGQNYFGLPEHGMTRWEPMRDPRNRIAFGQENIPQTYWLQNPRLRDAKTSSQFASVTPSGTDSADDAIYPFSGARIVFQLRNEHKVMERTIRIDEAKEPCSFCKRYNFAEARAVVNKYGAHISLVGGTASFPEHEQFNYCPVCGRALRSRSPKEVQHDN